MGKKKRLHSIWLEIPRSIVKIFVRKQRTVWEEQFEEHPCIFVCNHERAFGPLAMLARFELYRELRPWVIGEICHAKEIPQYAVKDYWCKPNKWYTWLYNHTVPYVACLICPPVMKGVRGIEVYHDARVRTTFKQSVEALVNGDKIVLFPEKPQAFGTYSEELMSGFVVIAQMYEKRTGKKLDMYPVHLNKDNRVIVVGKPIQLVEGLKSKEQLSVVGKVIADEMSELKTKSEVLSYKK